METRRQFLGTVGPVIAGTACAIQLASGEAVAAPAGKIRIGTIDTRSVALAFGRSARRQKYLKEFIEKAKQLEAAKDPGAAAMKKQAKESQELAHFQVFGNAPIDDVLEQLKDDLPVVAKAQNVSAIVVSAPFHDSSVEVVDVTRAVVDRCEPDEKTLKVIEDLKKHPPVSFSELARHGAD